MVVDENGKPLPDGEAGELYLGGSQVAAGYWRDAERTAERFRAPQCTEAADMRWYRTGDLAAMSKEHYLSFADASIVRPRSAATASNLWKSRTPCALPRERTRSAQCRGRSTTAASPPVSSASSRARRKALRKSSMDVAARCPPTWCRRHIYQLDKWPLNPNGKTDYKPMNEFLKQAGRLSHEQERQLSEHNWSCFRKGADIRSSRTEASIPRSSCSRWD